MDARQRQSESATRHDVLSRMIDEELLVQHALDSGAAETSPEVRAALVRSAITRVNAEAAAGPITVDELSEYSKRIARDIFDGSSLRRNTFLFRVERPSGRAIARHRGPRCLTGGQPHRASFSTPQTHHHLALQANESLRGRWPTISARQPPLP